MLSTGATEAAERIFGDIIAALDRDFLDGIGHVLDSDFKKALGNLFRCEIVACCGFDFRRQDVEFFRDHIGIQRAFGVRPENLREMLGLDLAQHDIAVGDSQRPTPAITGRSRIGSGRFRADAKARAVKIED